MRRHEPDRPAAIVNIVGERVALGPPSRDLIPVYLQWVNDFEVTRTLAMGMRPVTREFEEEWYERMSRSDRDLVFTLYERASLRPIGSAGLHNIDHRDRIAELGLVIGEKGCWGKGYGTEATRLVLGYGFTALGLHNVLLRVYSVNERAIRAYQRAGFRVIGRRRESHRIDGRLCDEILMDCLATEFGRTASGEPT